MRRNSLLLALFSALLLALAFSGVSIAGPVQQEEAAPIHLKAATFVPARGEAPPLPPGLTISGFAEGVRGYYIVQFRGPVQQAWKDEITASGAELLDYIPDFAFKARMNPAQAAQIQSLANVAWVGVFQPAYKLSPNLIRSAEPNLYLVQLEPGGDARASEFEILAAGAQVLQQSGEFLVVVAASDQLDVLAQVLDVAWIENYTLREKFNEYGAGGIMGANTANSAGYDGSTQIVAVADTGLGGGTTGSAHPDIPASRVVGIFDWPGANSALCYTAFPDGPQDVDSGHGTHVAGSVLSDGGPGGEGKGSAPAARLVFQAVEDYADMFGLCSSNPDGYYLLGIPSDIRQLFQQAYDNGARIHSNSWGSTVNGDYTSDSVNADNFVWNHRDMAITFSAGNDGIDANADGAIDNDSLGSPATAKNVITVGASENDRAGNYACDSSLTYTNPSTGASCNSQGGANDIFTYGSAWPADYPAEPIKSDPSAGNPGQMAAFSSRGPTDDNRIKPDVVAPGTWVLSGYSDRYQQGYDPSPNPRNSAWQYDGWGFPLNASYKYMGGTSMSNPLTAGGAAVVRDFYQKAFGHLASAALVKAALINSAVDMLDENNDGANDNDFPIPNNHEGWGRVSLAAAADGTAQFVDPTSGLSTGGSASYNFTVGTAGSPLKVTLVWSDYPSTAGASVNLVNDLDLTVSGPGGVSYKGNVFAGGWSQTGGSADRRNNVENVYAQSAAAGTWTVQVTGFNVPNGPQPYALVVDGVFGVGPTPTFTDTPLPTVAPTDTPIPTLTPTPAPGDVLYLSSTTGGTAGGVSFADEDILTFNTASGVWAMFFDGSDVGVGGADLDAFDLQSDGSLLLSFENSLTITGVGTAQDEDIVRFTPTSTGSTTAGSFAMVFDGSDVGLADSSNEDVDAFALLADGRLVVSTLGSFAVTGASGGDEDLIAFTPTSLGSTTSGTWALYFDGSDVGLNDSNSEDVNGTWISPSGPIYLTTVGAFAVTGVSGDGSDIFICTPSSLGNTTACTFSAYWDGSTHGFSAEVTDALEVVKP